MILLDTHAWIWWASAPDRLSKRATRAIDGATRIGIAAISCWEFVMLVEKGRISVDREPLEWMQEALEDPRVVLLPLTPAVAVASMSLADRIHGDPADRMIVATALIESATLVTRDDKLRDFDGVSTIW